MNEVEADPPENAAKPGAAPDVIETCPKCLKPLSLCVCDGIVALKNRIALLILQHPQEQDKTLGTARITAQHFTDATFKVGLSWPSLAKALGRPADPQHWAILYLGSAQADLPAHEEITILDGKGKGLPNQDRALGDLEGIVLLDGTWSQAKALWWRNPWVLKCRRIVLNPRQPSRYGKLRREPRREGLSTLEAAALLLSRLEHKPEIQTELLATFDRMLRKYREANPHAGDRRRRKTSGHQRR